MNGTSIIAKISMSLTRYVTTGAGPDETVSRAVSNRPTLRVIISEMSDYLGYVRMEDGLINK